MNYRDHKHTTADWTEAPLISDRVAALGTFIGLLVIAGVFFPVVYWRNYMR